MGCKRCHDKLGAENIVKELSGSLPLFLATNQVPVNEALECHIANWKIQHCQQYPIFSSERATRHPLIGKRFFEHAWHESNHMLRIVVLQKYSTVTFIKKDQRSKPSLSQLDIRDFRSFLKRLIPEHQRIIFEITQSSRQSEMFKRRAYAP